MNNYPKPEYVEEKKSVDYSVYFVLGFALLAVIFFSRYLYFDSKKCYTYTTGNSVIVSKQEAWIRGNAYFVKRMSDGAYVAIPTIGTVELEGWCK
jgi:hypothetical protein